MRYEEERIAAAVEELKAFSAKIRDNNALDDLATIIAGFQTMRPYVSVGLKVCAPGETMEAINRLHESGTLTQELCNNLLNALEVARKRNLPSPAQEAVRKPCRRVASRSLARSVVFKANRVNRMA